MGGAVVAEGAVYGRLLEASQGVICAYTIACLGNREQAGEVLQETNLALWRKIDTYDIERPFIPWALGVARIQIRAFRQRLRRDRLVFDEDISNRLGMYVAENTRVVNRNVEALQECLKRLPPKHKSLVDGRYVDRESIGSIAASIGKSPSAVSVALFRIREELAKCIKKRILSKRGEGTLL